MHPASRYLLRPLCPHHHCRLWRTPAHSRTSEMSAWPCPVLAPWRSPSPYALIPGAGCDTGHVSMPTATFETQLFSAAQRVGPTPQPSRSGAVFVAVCSTPGGIVRRIHRDNARVAVELPFFGDRVAHHKSPHCQRQPPACVAAYRRRSGAATLPTHDTNSPPIPTYKKASCDHAPALRPLVRPSYGDVARQVGDVAPSDDGQQLEAGRTVDAGAQTRPPRIIAATSHAHSGAVPSI